MTGTASATMTTSRGTARTAIGGSAATVTYVYRLSGALASTTSLPLPTGAVVISVRTS